MENQNEMKERERKRNQEEGEEMDPFFVLMLAFFCCQNYEKIKETQENVKSH